MADGVWRERREIESAAQRTSIVFACSVSIPRLVARSARCASISTPYQVGVSISQQAPEGHTISHAWLNCGKLIGKCQAVPETLGFCRG